MIDDLPFEPPIIIDDDICWAISLLKLPTNAFCGDDGTDPRQKVLKIMKPIDVAACPGSGKTTLLVAKLAILAMKWKYRTRGICVISHTNAARHQIETLLGHTTVKRSLLSYPHFIGTIHGFVNEFLALPWLRSKGCKIKMIDTDMCIERRWKNLSFKTRSGLERNKHTRSVLTVKSPDFCVGEVRWGKKGKLGRESPVYCDIRKVCQQSINEGYFCYDEIFMWAGELMDKMPTIVTAIRNRFPLLFIDEAQDNSEDQSAILHRIFMDGSGAVIRQRFGDENQAIFDFMKPEKTITDKFPKDIDSMKKDLPNSHRFGEKIANLADSLGIIPFTCGLKGHGPKRKILDSGVQEGCHTIFLFDDNSIGRVLSAYGELLINTFSEEELHEGSGKGMFVAVGQVHRDKGYDHKPRHVGHYWPDYDPELTNREPKPQTFVQYVFAGQGKAEMSGESYLAVEKIAEGILRLAGMIEGGASHPQRRHSHRHILKLLERYIDVRERYEDLVTKFAVERVQPTNETWNGHWRGLVQDIAKTIAGASQFKSEANGFLEWKDGPGNSMTQPIAPKSRVNIYHFSKNGKKVAIRVGSVHSVKGETHMSTLVLETFWQDNKGRHNLELLMPWLCKSNCGGQGIRVQQQYRLKLHYVAMTRPTHLLCLAMKLSIFKDSKGNLDQEKIKKLEECGWRIKPI